ncbi:hypothetical protein OIE68_42870 [Nocardia vinacea]|uniref:Uncharacterized protein n=1 Tax=Nocardia vinacea TaxID=96468 RepID=A0ABZ1YJR3_9NOCA|nr:hypothetical protein OIE68_42870 [Nocardia vinacea]
MIEFLKSNAGIFTLATIALVFQLVGAGIVVYDLFRHYGVAGKFAQNMSTIERAHQELQDDSWNVTLTQYTKDGDEAWAKMIRPTVEVLMRANKAGLAADTIAQNLLATVAVPNRWRTWIGPIALLLGIMIAYLATMFSVR